MIENSQPLLIECEAGWDSFHTLARFTGCYLSGAFDYYDVFSSMRGRWAALILCWSPTLANKVYQSDEMETNWNTGREWKWSNIIMFCVFLRMQTDIVIRLAVQWGSMQPRVQDQSSAMVMPHKNNQSWRMKSISFMLMLLSFPFHVTKIQTKAIQGCLIQ